MRCFCGAKIWKSMLGFLAGVGGLKNAWVFYRFYRVKILFKLALGVGD
ncbi:hypothetical protein HPCPY1662_0117 [Helicobacter pylori CPY1662]|uniref:Uncharacterized protein n=1 Tax=Helicobacter pylori TaxID=210 RepID=A0A6F8E8D4_HELPX|nr:hypothetical protein [Helicobacter pylori]EMR61174.1 hypothetical protein HPCPY1662_0117 [Helicobacter pylori CPY1662]